MGIKAKLIGQTTINTGGDVFHDIFTKTPHLLSTMTPERVQKFTLLEGKLGTTGSVIRWDYTLEGKKVFTKTVIEVINEGTKSVIFKILEGHLIDLYKNITVTYHVDIIGHESLVTWTLDYEKRDVDTPHPGTMVNFFLHMIEDIEYHHENK